MRHTIHEDLQLAHGISYEDSPVFADGDIVELTNPDGSVDLYQVACNDAVPCSGCCCLYAASKCIRWSRSDGVNTCILSYKHKGVFNLAFRDLNQVIENI